MKDLIQNVYVSDDNFTLRETIEVLSISGSSGSLGYVIPPMKIQFIVCFVFHLVTSQNFILPTFKTLASCSLNL